MSTLAPKRVLTYINGVRVDVISVTVTTTRDDVVSFFLSVPGIPEWDLLPPRSHAVVFFADEVSGLWRMLVEGEFISDNKEKSAAGARQVTLGFRSLHGIFAHAVYASLGIGSSGDGKVEEQLAMVSNGRRVLPTGNKQSDMPTPAALLGAIVNTATSASVFFPQLVKQVLSQLPVEAYYHHERYLGDKMFSLLDNEIKQIVDVRRAGELSQYQTNNSSFENQTLLSILRRYEGMMMYQHIPMVAPPFYDPDGKGSPRDVAGQETDSLVSIPELIFTPYLYNVIPPACNVIFQDQIQMLSRGIDYATMPTRVITKLASSPGSTQPKFYMSNTPTDSFDAATSLITSYPGNNPGLAATHDLLSGEELNRGVVAQTLPLSIEIFPSKPGDAAKPEEEKSWTSYWDANTRHYFAEVTGAAKVASLTTVFLPMLIPGVPCLVEDKTGPFHGYIDSISHVLSNDSPPQTSVRISQVRPALVIEGKDVTPPLPTWLNAAYLPSGVSGTTRNTQGGVIKTNGTWSRLLGVNAYDKFGGTAFAAMVPDNTIEAGIVQSIDDTPPPLNRGDAEAYASQQVNMDKLAAKVIPIYSFSKDMKFTGISTGSIADEMRKQPDPVAAMAGYNWRPGVSLSAFMTFHRLTAISSVANVDQYENSIPPETLFDPSSVESAPARLFAAPYRMRFTGEAPLVDGELRRSDPNNTSSAVYGGYRLEAVDGRLYNPARQLAMLTIKRALNRVITTS
jgi:hypothetical protein